MPKSLPTGLPSMLPLCPNVSLCSCQQNLHKLVIGWNRDGIVNLTLDLSAFSLLSVIFVFCFFFLLRMFMEEKEKQVRRRVNPGSLRPLPNLMRVREERRPMGCFSHFISSSLILKKSSNTASLSH